MDGKAPAFGYLKQLWPWGIRGGLSAGPAGQNLV
jgi:hypothetical protein